MGTLRQLLSGAVKTLASSLVLQVLTAVSGMIIAHRLGPEGRGTIAVVLLWPQTVMWIASLGYGSAIQYYYPRLGHEARRTLVGQAVILGLIMGFIALIAMDTLYPLLFKHQPPAIVHMLRLYTIIVPVGVVGEFFLSAILGAKEFGAYNVARVMQVALYFTGVVYLLLSQAISVEKVLVLQFLAGVLTTGWVSWRLYRIGVLCIGYDRSLFRQSVVYGLKVYAGGLATLFNSQLDRMLIGAFLTSWAMGEYSVSVTVATLPIQVSAAVSTLLVPLVAEPQGQGRLDLLAQSGRFVFTILSLAVLGMFPAVPTLITIMYGHEFSYAVGLTRILLIGTVFLGTADVLRQGMRGMGQPGQASICDGLGFVATAATLALLLPKYGLYGAAVASLLAYALVLGIYLVRFSLLFGVPIRRLFVIELGDLRDLTRLAALFLHGRRVNQQS